MLNKKEHNLSLLLGKKPSDKPAIVYKNQKLSYKSLFSKVLQRSQEITGLSGQLVGISLSNPIDRLINVLSIIEVGGYCFLVNPDLENERSYLLDAQLDKKLNVISDTEIYAQFSKYNIKKTLSSTDIYQLKGDKKKTDYNSKGGIVLRTISNQEEAYIVDFNTMISHRDTAVKAFGMEEFIQIAACEEIQSYDLLEWILPALKINSTLFFSDSSDTTSTKEGKGVLKINSALLEQEITTLQLLDKQLPFHVNQIVINCNTKINKQTLKKLSNTFPLVDKVTYTYQPAGIPVSAIKGQIKLAEIEKDDQTSLVFSQPFGKVNISILDANLQKVPTNVKGILAIESKCFITPISEHTTLCQVNIGREERFMRKMEHYAKFLPNGTIQLVNKVSRTLLIKGQSIPLDNIEEKLRLHPNIADAAVIGRDVDGEVKIVAFVKLAKTHKEIKANIRRWLKRFFNVNQLPKHIEIVENFPTKEDGTIELAALEITPINLTTTKVITPLQEELVQIWQSLLGLGQLSIEDSFFEMGGHSLLAIKLVSIIRDTYKVDISITDIFARPTIKDVAQYLESASKADIKKINKVERTVPNQHFPLSFSQERLWFIDQFQGSNQYHIPAVLELKGQLNKEALELAFQKIIARHAALKTVIRVEEGTPYQMVLETDWKMNQVVCKDSTDKDLLISEAIEKPFDLSKDCMLRALLIEHSENTHTLVVVMHHIASDGWSAFLLLEELKELYQANLEQRTPKLKNVDTQYADYAVWQQTEIKGDYLNTQLEYWKQKLDDVAPLELSTDYSRPPQQSFKGATQTFLIDQQVKDQLATLSRQEGVTLFMTMLAAFKVFLYKYTGQTDICVGSPIAGRNHQEIEPLIGFFVNTLALRSNINQTDNFIDFIQLIKSTTLEAYSNQDAPFEKIVEAIGITRDMSRNPIFQVMFGLEQVPELSGIEMGEVVAHRQPTNQQTALFDLSFDIEDTATGLALNIEYCTDLFKATTINRMAGHFINLLHAIINNPNQTIASIPIITKQEKVQIIETFNDNKEDFSFEYTTDQIIDQIAEKYPNEIAISDHKTKCTYQELSTKSNRIANILVDNNIAIESTVGVLTDRSVEMLQSICAIWKAGGVYLPVHPELPKNRVNLLLEDAHATVLITEEKYLDFALDISKECSSIQHIICLDGNVSEIDQPSKNKQINYFGPQDIVAQSAMFTSRSQIDNLAYIIYTSGSTGKPKGAMIEHRGMLNHLFIMIKDLAIDKNSNIAQNASQSFDISVWQMFAALIEGGQTVVYQTQETLYPNAFLDKVDRDKITVLEVVPSYLSLLLDEIEDKTTTRLESLKFLLVTGETIKKSLVKRWFKTTNAIPLINAYGPTEAADDITLFTMKEVPDHSTIPIGKSLANLNVYIVNEVGQLCPIGVKGEIWVSGIGVGRGYINNQKKTDAVFTIDSFCEEQNRRLYKTGDIGRYLPDGNIEFYGRKDYQVKIRGHRIELEEIEQCLSEISTVKEAIITTNDQQEGLNFIYGYVTTNNDTENGENLRQALSKLLPEYMIPSQIMILDKFPLTPNGKVNRKALPIPTVTDNDAESTVIQPRNTTENSLVEIWKPLLEIETIGINQSFFKLGGHSLKVIKMVSQVQKKLDIQISIKDVFEHPTIEELAKIIEGKKTSQLVKIPVAAPNDFYPISYAQRRIWIANQLEENSSAYNAYIAFEIEGDLKLDCLKEAVINVVKRHSSLRTTFIVEEGLPKQKINSENYDQYYEVIDYRNQSLSPKKLKIELIEEANLAFDLANDCLFRAKLYILDENKFIFFGAMHHIICDGWSNNILVKEILQNYQAFVNQQPSPLPQLTIQYKDYAVWRANQVTADTSNIDQQYWHKKLSGDLPVLNLPTYKPRPDIQTFEGETKIHSFNKNILAGLKSISSQSDASLFMTLTTLLKVLFYKYTGQNDIVIGTVSAGRTHPDLEHQIGYYLNTLALRNNIDPSKSFSQLLEVIRESTLEAFEHEKYPFDKLVNELDINRVANRNPIFDVLVLLQNFDEDEESLFLEGFKDLDITPLILESRGSIFDMDFDFVEEKESLKLSLTYNNHIYEAQQIDTLINHLEKIMIDVIDNTNTSVGHINMVDESEQAQLIAFNDTAKQMPLDLSYHHYLEKYAEKTPDKTAIIFKDKKLSYQELNDRTNQLARSILKQADLGTDDLVGVLIDRSDTVMSTVLALWKTGAAYIPIDKKVPDNRILSIVDDGAVKLFIADKTLVSDTLKAEISSYCKLVFIQDLLEASIQEQTDNLNIEYKPDSLAFTIFTSGSTGKPKGAMNEHIGVMNHALATADYLNMDENTVLVQNASQSFDISIWQFFTALITGGTTAIYEDEIISNPNQLLKNLITHKVTVFQVVPSYLSMLIDIVDEDKAAYPISLTHLICCGEAIKPKQVEKWLTLYPGTKIVNDYGPAEASDGTHWNILDSIDLTETTNIPIGSPIYNMSSYIVDDYMNLCPLGVIGEICVAGIGVGRGYINEPEKTQKVFMLDSFAPNKQQRLYKTGDLGRLLPNGMVEFHGRKDYQVKVNGQRIELGEIEAKLLQLDNVKAAAVVDMINPQTKRKYLTGFVVGQVEAQIDTAQLKKALSDELPPYMVPSSFQILENLPLTPNGKVDRKYLSKFGIVEKEAAKIEYVAPETKEEIMLAEAWQKVLQKEKVSALDNFYEIGGDSISAIQIASHLYKNKYKVSVKDIMRYPIIQELASRVTSLTRIADQGTVTGEVKLTPIQSHFFHMEKMIPNHYNQSVCLKFKDRIKPDALLKALKFIQHWHDALRTTYEIKEKDATQYINDNTIPVNLSYFNFRKGEKMEEIIEKANEVQSSISLENGPLMQSAIFDRKDADYLLIAIHHLIIDVVSWRIIIEDLSLLYQQALDGKPLKLMAKTDSFKTWSEVLTKHSQSEKFNKEKAYWNPILKQEFQQIPYDFNKSNNSIGKVEDVQSCSIQINEHYSKLLDNKVHSAFHTNINDILLTALGISVNRYFKLSSVPVMLESHGRVKLDKTINTNRTVGWFTSEFPVLLETDCNHDHANQIKLIKDYLHKVPNNGLGYMLLKYMNNQPNETNENTLLPQISFNYIGKIENGNNNNNPFVLLEAPLGSDESGKNISDYPLEFFGASTEQGKTFTIKYHSTQFKQETIEQLLGVYLKVLKEIIDFCVNRDYNESTPSDFEYAELSLTELDDLKSLF